MAPIPIALCGKSSTMATSFAKSMLPEYEVIHHFPTTTSAHTELPALLSGTPINSRTLVATNPSHKIPAAIMVGAGFSESELEEMRQIPGAEKVAWLFPDALKTAATTLSGPFLMSVIVRRVKGCLRAHGLEEGGDVDVKARAEGQAGEVWKF